MLKKDRNFKVEKRPQLLAKAADCQIILSQWLFTRMVV